MPFSAVASRFTVDGAPTPPATTGTPFYHATMATLQQLYDGSTGLAAAVDAWLALHPGTNIAIQFLANNAQAVVNGGLVRIDPAFFNSNAYLALNGTVAADTFASGLAHELGHAVGGWFDNDSFSNLAGDNVVNVNRWYSNLGFAPQASYEAYYSPLITSNVVLTPGTSYTAGAAIKNAIIDRGIYTSGSFTMNTGNLDLAASGVTGSTLVIGGSGANFYAGTASRDWLYGNDGNDTLDGGDGSDLVYGGAAADTLRGGNGDDEIWGGDNPALSSGVTDGNDTIEGGAGKDKIYGGGGNDTISGGAGDDQIWGGEKGVESNPTGESDTASYAMDSSPVTVTYNGSGATPSVNVKGGGSGTDALHSVEKVVGTTGRDLVKIVGSIAAGTDLTIDANGGQGSSPADTIDGRRASSAINIQINPASGGGYIEMQSTGGRIKLEGFNTNIAGSDYDDVIEDYSSGHKNIDGGDGNDVITAEGSGSTLVGGNGDDIITGSDGNDVIFGGDSVYLGFQNAVYIGNQLFGGEGNDYIVSSTLYDYIEGGDGSDYIELRYGLDRLDNSTDNIVDGGAGNDVIDLRHRFVDYGYTNGRGANIKFGAGSGNDVILGNFNNALDNAPGHKYNSINILLDGLNVEDLTVIWDVVLEDGHYKGSGDMVILTPTGDSIFLPEVYGDIYVHGDDIRFYQSTIAIEFSSPYYFSDDVTFSFGDVSQYLGAEEEFAQSTSPDPSETAGGSGNDQLSGGSGHDQLSGGAGNDSFEASSGSDDIDGGDGIDTVQLFGGRGGFSFVQDGSDLVVTDLNGTYGEMRLTSVEHIEFLLDGQTYNTAGDLFGYVGTSSNDSLQGTDVDNRMEGHGGSDTIVGGDGSDLIDGGADDDFLCGDSGDDELRGGSGADAIQGGSGDDWLYGDAGEDALDGGDGNDVLMGGVGADLLTGGEGIDTANYGASTAAVFASLTSASFGGDADGDVLVGIENLSGSDYDDVLTGDSSDNILSGGYGDDLIDGGAGEDQAYYEYSLSDLLVGRNQDGSITVTEGSYEIGDTLFNIELLTFEVDNFTIATGVLPELGTAGDDLIEGSILSDILRGFGGDDVFLTGGGGKNLIDGGGGYDEVILVGSISDYSVFREEDGTVTIWDNTGIDNFSSTMLVDVESIYFDEDSSSIQTSDLPPLGTSSADHIVGSNRGDVLFGGEGDDHLEGLDSSDTLNGGSGNDLLEGQGAADNLFGLEGNDVLIGGDGDDYILGDEGDDVAVFAGNQADYQISVDYDMVQVLDLDPVSDGDDGVDWLGGVETLQFKDGSVSVTDINAARAIGNNATIDAHIWLDTVPIVSDNITTLFDASAYRVPILDESYNVEFWNEQRTDAVGADHSFNFISDAFAGQELRNFDYLFSV